MTCSVFTKKKTPQGDEGHRENTRSHEMPWKYLNEWGWGMFCGPQWGKKSHLHPSTMTITKKKGQFGRRSVVQRYVKERGNDFKHQKSRKGGPGFTHSVKKR